jgi:hypothetical protein
MFKYEKTDSERYAEKLLRDKGWTVTEPKCPLCKGWGYMGQFKTLGVGPFSTSVLSQSPCPNGCPAPMMFFPATI